MRQMLTKRNVLIVLASMVLGAFGAAAVAYTALSSAQEAQVRLLCAKACYPSVGVPGELGCECDETKKLVPYPGGQ